MSSAISAEEIQQTFIAICCSVSLPALLVYEYLITFDREYELVWKRRFSLATLLFSLARYSVLLDFILNLPSINPLSMRSCSAIIWSTSSLDLFFVLLVAAFSSLRAYALSGREWKVASLILILLLVPCVFNLFLHVRQVVVVAPPPVNCTSVPLFSLELDNIAYTIIQVTYVGRAATITADIFIIAVTIRNTYWKRRLAAEANVRTPLHTLILRDGTVYFLALLMLNIADIVFLYFGETFENFSYIGTFINPITAVLISRFMLNLREIDASQCGTEDSSRPSFVGSIQFAAFVEPLGAPLDHEFSFSAIDPSSLDEQGADRESESEEALGNDEEIVFGETSIHGPPQAEADFSGVSE